MGPKKRDPIQDAEVVSAAEPTPWADDEADAAELADLRARRTRAVDPLERAQLDAEIRAAAELQRLGR